VIFDHRHNAEEGVSPRPALLSRLPDFARWSRLSDLDSGLLFRRGIRDELARDRHRGARLPRSASRVLIMVAGHG
jgi:hypothetical protein